VSFGNPVTNEWFQILAENGLIKVQDLGKLNRNGRSLRETIDDLVRNVRRQDPDRANKSPAARATYVGGPSESSRARAGMLRDFIAKLES
jgi:hypothetical protein